MQSDVESDLWRKLDPIQALDSRKPTAQDLHPQQSRKHKVSGSIKPQGRSLSTPSATEPPFAPNAHQPRPPNDIRPERFLACHHIGPIQTATAYNPQHRQVLTTNLPIHTQIKPSRPPHPSLNPSQPNLHHTHQHHPTHLQIMTITCTLTAQIVMRIFPQINVHRNINPWQSHLKPP